MPLQSPTHSSHLLVDGASRVDDGVVLVHQKVAGRALHPATSVAVQALNVSLAVAVRVPLDVVGFGLLLGGEMHTALLAPLVEQGHLLHLGVLV